MLPVKCKSARGSISFFRQHGAHPNPPIEREREQRTCTAKSPVTPHRLGRSTPHQPDPNTAYTQLTTRWDVSQGRNTRRVRFTPYSAVDPSRVLWLVAVARCWTTFENAAGATTSAWMLPVKCISAHGSISCFRQHGETETETEAQ